MSRFLTLYLAILLFPVVALAHNESRIGFIENKNQFHENVLFKADFNQYTVFLENNRFTFLVQDAEDMAQVHDIIKAPFEEQQAFFARGHAYRVNFAGSNPDPVQVSELPHGFNLNYYIGNDPDKWASGVQSYKRVRYNALYPGVDLLAVVDQGNLKYDFIVSPGAATDQIALEFEGLEGLSIADGDLVLTTSVGEIKELKPFAYQHSGLGLVPVACAYVLDGERVTFAFPDGFDASKELIIDPVVVASTLSGTPGGGSNYGHGATFDLAGNIYSHAIAFGSEYPVIPGAVQTTFMGSTDIAISKYNPDGTDLIYATYIGGGNGDYPHSTIANQFEELFVYGSTSSSDYPTTADAFDQDYNDGGGGWGGADIVISKISADGTVLQGSTYVGGAETDGRNTANSLNYGDTYRGEIYLDQFGFPYIVSQSESPDFPVTPGAYETTHQGGQDAVVFKMNQNLSQMLWASFLGSPEGDTGYGVRVTDNGDVLVCGSTSGTDFPTTAGAYQTALANGSGTLDAFISRFSPDGSQLLVSTFVGTDETDQAFFIDIDNDEDIWIYGQSAGDWPVVGGGYSNANGKLYVSKFNPALNDLQISSRIGPGTGFNGDAAPVAFLVDRCDRIYICGYNAADGFELTDDFLYDDGSFFLSAWEEDMSELAFATYYGGSHVDGGTSRFDKSGIVYQGVCNAGPFPTNPDAWATTQDVGWDIGVFKIDFELAGVNAAITTNDDISGCAPHEIQFNNFSVGTDFIWNFGDGSPESTEFEPIHTYTEPGMYTISLISSDSLSCNLADTAYLYIEIGSEEAFQPEFTYEVDCETQTVTFNNETGADFLDYEWDMGDGTIVTDESPVHTYDDQGLYNVILTATDNACDNTEVAEAEIEVFGALEAVIANDAVESCNEIEVVFDNQSNGQTYLWDFGDGTTSEQENPTHTFTGPGVYDVVLTAFHDQTCNPTDTAMVTIAVGSEQIIDAVFDVFQTDCEGLIVETQNQSEGNFLSFEWDMGDGTIYTGQEDVTHQYSDVGNYTITLSIEDTLCLFTESAEVALSVNNQATANAVLDNAEGCPPLEVTFENLSTGQEFFWDFGDGTTSTEFLPEHTYEDPGEYEVMLVVVGSAVCPGQDTTYANVTVTDNTVDALFSYAQSGLCADYTADFVSESVGEDVQLNWTFDGNEVNDIADYTYGFPGAGTYTVTLTATEANCLNSDTYTDEVTIVPGFNLDLGPDRDICYYESAVVLDTGVDPSEISFEWSTDDGDVPAIQITEPGTYSVTATDGTCDDFDEVEIGQGTQYQGSYSLEICEGLSHEISIPAYGTSYQWQTGQTTNSIFITRAGNYGFTFIDEGGCVQTDTVYVTARLPEASLFIPNTFTPNGDGINELFKVVGEEIERFEIRVFNRWGEQLFYSEDPELGWNGSINNEGQYYVPDGVYPYIVKVKSTCKADETEYRGNVTVLR